MRLAPVLAALCLLPLLSAAAPAPATAPSVVCDPACDVRVMDHASAPSLWVAPNGNVFVAANDYELGSGAPCGDGSDNVWVGVARSTDSGRSFAGALLPQHPGDAAGLLSLFPCSRDPALAVDPLTQRVVVNAVGTLGLPVLVTGLWAQQSYDNASTWDQQLVFVGAGPLANAAPSLAPDTDGFGIIGDNGPNSGMFLGSLAGDVLLLSENLGLAKKQGLGSLDVHKNWETTPALNLQAGDNGITSNSTFWTGSGVRAFTDIGHTYYLGWTDADHDIIEGHSIDFGHSFEGAFRAGHIDTFDASSSPVPVSDHPGMAIDNTHGPTSRWIYAAWANGPGTPAIVASVSTDLGHKFGAPVQVSDAGAPGLRFAPAVEVGPDGTVWAAWYDQRVDPGGSGVAVFAAVSTDGGVSWGSNVQVSPVFDARLALDEHGAPSLGEHLALHVDAQGIAHVAWTDARDGHAAVYAARLTA